MGEEDRLAELPAFPDDPVGKKPSASHKQYDLARKDSPTTCAPDHQDVAGPYKRNHTGSGNAQPRFSKAAQNLCQKFKLQDLAPNFPIFLWFGLEH